MESPGSTRLIAALAFAAGIAGAQAAPVQCAAQAGAARDRLLELYTSEGCSSCPPAEAQLQGAPAGAHLAALEFHVDYWDGLGWRDRFADPRFTERQRAQAARDGGSAIYTPQVVLDGRSWTGWYRGHPQPAPIDATATTRVTIARAPGEPLRVHVATTLAPPASGAEFRNYVALTQDGLSSAVRAGENRGATLRHDAVVRAFAGPLPLGAADAELPLPQDADPVRLHVVAFVQRPRDGAIAQALVCPFAAGAR